MHLCLYFFILVHSLSPLILLANWISLGIRVILLACNAQRFASSRSHTKYVSAASCKASSAVSCILISCFSFCAISLTSLLNGNFGIRLWVDFWYFLISASANAPGRYLFFFSFTLYALHILFFSVSIP